MRVVAVADTHTFESELAAIPDGDVFVHAGDLLRHGTLAELLVVAEWIRGLPHSRKIVIAGNHDRCFQASVAASREALGAEVTYLEDQPAEIDGVRFWGSPWQPELNDWAFNLPRGPALQEKWDRIMPATDILITHGPPRGIGDRVGDRRVGCDDLLHAVHRIQPALHLFGHIHEDGGFWRHGSTCFANVTTMECERAATAIDFNPRTREVVPVSIPPASSTR
jgi:Icc-related predicted phosphoesterase